MQLGFWSEYLDYQELLKPENIRLIKKYDLKIYLAIDKERLEKILPLLKRFQKEEIKFALWPLLDLEGDYWPSERNVEEFSFLIDEILSILKKEKIKIKEIIFDLEPPRAQTLSALRGKSNISFEKCLYFLAKTRIKENMNMKRFRRARKKLNRLVKKLQSLEIRVTATYPSDFILEDFWTLGGNAVQDFQETPLAKINWDEINIQFYNSALKGYSKKLSITDLSRALYELARRAKIKLNTEISLSLGIVGPIPNGAGAINYPIKGLGRIIYENPEEILVDIQTVLAAGVEKIFIYSLDGLLELGSADKSIEKILSQKPKIPPLAFSSITYRIVRTFLRALLELISIPRLFKK